MGVQLFGGKFYKCVYMNTHNRVNISENITNKIDCLKKNFTWENSRINFDNVFSGYLALFQVVSFEFHILMKFFFYSNRQHSKVGWKSWRMQLMLKK
jgi:hypothetical protein